MGSSSADLAHPASSQGGSTLKILALSFVFSPFLLLFLSAITLSAASCPNFSYRQFDRGKG